MNSRVPIIIADDDPDDRQLMKEALLESRLLNEVHFVNDGEELLEFISSCRVLPGLILLDLNMPKKDGKEVLKDLKSNPKYKHIPIVILTTSQAEEDILRSYDLGANSFISKPVTFSGLVGVMQEIGRYWFEIVELPQKDQNLGKS